LTLRTAFDQVFRGFADGKVTGLWAKETHKVKGHEHITNLTLDKTVSKVTLKLSMSTGDYGHFTDVSVLITDSSDKLVAKAGFSMRRMSISFANEVKEGAENSTYQIKVMGAYALAAENSWSLTVEEEITLVESVNVDMWCGGYTNFSLYPNVDKRCQVELGKVPRAAPRGYKHLGYVRLLGRRGRGLVMKIPLIFKIKQ
jgi:hypothetical protein